jgi:hypothetical protein
LSYLVLDWHSYVEKPGGHSIATYDVRNGHDTEIIRFSEDYLFKTKKNTSNGGVCFVVNQPGVQKQ